MLKAKSELAKHLEKEILRVISNNEVCKGICEYVNREYSIPKSMASDFISMRIGMDQANEFMLFCLLDGYEKVTEKKKSEIDTYFTMQEAKTYRVSKFEVDTIKFPLRFKVIKIAEDQWIGNIDSEMLMKLRTAQMIVYNTNAQRVMTKVVKGDKEYYKITINERAVKEIKESLRQNNFIPNAITLNIPTDMENDFYYDDDRNELVINSLQAFYILDGFHRFLSISQASDEDSQFRCSMELRIVHWDDAKSQTFVYQEDKRTPIKKIDAASMDMNNVANIIVERLNSSINCNMKGLISRNQGVINFSEMAALVNWFYIKNNDSENKNAIQIRTIKELTDNLNILTENNIELLDKRWDWRYLLTVMCVFDYIKDKTNLKENMINIIDRTYSVIKDTKDKKLNNRTVRKVLIDLVMGVIESIL